MIAGTRRGIARVILALLLICAAPDLALTQGVRRPPTRALAIRAELAGVLLQSKRYDQAATEYRTLLALDPADRSYRLGLARALTWGGRPRDAERELLVLERQRPGDPVVESLLLSARSEMRASSDEAAAWLAQRPVSTAYRRILARAFASEGRTVAALAHYDTILHARPIPDILIDRAHLHLDRGDEARAERDVVASIASAPSLAAYVLLGDLYRWRGDFDAARAWYVRARMLQPDAGEVAAAFSRLARDERPAVAFLPNTFDPGGWQTLNTAAGDNLGARLATYEVRRGVPVRRNDFDGSVGVKLLRLSDRAAPADREAHGYGADLALSRDYEDGRFYARARARAGLIYHPSADIVHDVGISLAGWVGAWGIGGELSFGPAYPTLLTLASLLPSAESGGGQLREQSAALSLAGPVANADVALRHQSSTFSDGNTRSILQGYARLPVRGHLALLYSASALSMGRAATIYWSPERYVAHSAGAEYAVRRTRGFSFAARALPGVAFLREWPGSPGLEGSRTTAAQLTGGIEATYRALSWEVGAALNYGSGRAGEYQRIDAMLNARILR